MPDPNARRDKALEGIARSLSDIVGLLDKIERNTRRVKFTNHGDDQRPNPFDVPQMPQPGGDDVKPQPDSFVKSSHPYFKPSSPVTEEGSNAIE